MSSECAVPLEEKAKEMKSSTKWWDAIQCDWIPLLHWIFYKKDERDNHNVQLSALLIGLVQIRDLSNLLLKINRGFLGASGRQ
jgi:hypothetical protein